MEDKIAINHIAFVWQSRGESFDPLIREKLLAKLDSRITVYNVGDYKDGSFFYRWKINVRYVGDLRFEMHYPVLVIMQNGRPGISKYNSELKKYRRAALDLTELAIQINNKVDKAIREYGYKPSLMEIGA